MCMFLSNESYDFTAILRWQYYDNEISFQYRLSWHLSITYQVVEIKISYSAVFVSFDTCLLVQLFFTMKVIDALAIYYHKFVILTNTHPLHHRKLLFLIAFVFHPAINNTLPNLSTVSFVYSSTQNVVNNTQYNYDIISILVGIEAIASYIPN